MIYSVSITYIYIMFLVAAVVPCCRASPHDTLHLESMTLTPELELELCSARGLRVLDTLQRFQKEAVVMKAWQKIENSSGHLRVDVNSIASLYPNVVGSNATTNMSTAVFTTLDVNENDFAAKDKRNGCMNHFKQKSNTVRLLAEEAVSTVSFSAMAGGQDLHVARDLPVLLGANVNARTNKTNDFDLKVKATKVDGAGGYGKTARCNDGEVLPDCPLDGVSSLEKLYSIDVKTNGGLDLDRDGIPELKLKRKAIEKDFGKKLNTIYEHGSDGAGDGDGRAGKKKL